MTFIQFPDCKGSLYIEVVVPPTKTQSATLGVPASPEPLASEGEPIILAWDASPVQTPPIEGYKMKVGPASTVYNESIDVGNVTQANYLLPYDTTKFFTVVSYNTRVNSQSVPEIVESVPSNEVYATGKRPPPVQPPIQPPIYITEGDSNAQIKAQILTLVPMSTADTKLLFRTLHDLYYPPTAQLATVAKRNFKLTPRG